MAFSPWAMRRLLDCQQEYMNQGLPVYMRLANDQVEQDQVGEQDEFASYGFQVTITGGVPVTGFQDVRVLPQPDVEPLSLHNIGLNAGRLQFGAHRFLISHSWVLQQMTARSLTDPYDVFMADPVIGIVHNNRLFSIEDLQPNTGGGGIISWTVLANQLEPKVA